MALDQKAAQEKALMYQILQAQMQELTNQASALEMRMVELENAENALKEVEGVKEGSEMLLPLGGGCYGYGTLNKKGRFMVEIGAGLVKEQRLTDALDTVKGKKKDVEEVAEKLKMEMEHMRNSMDKIGLELQEIQRAAQKEQKKDDDSITVD
jgi:prefoldin alpha subunit